MGNLHLETFKSEREKVLKFLHAEFSKLQTGRASAGIVENVMVDAYGQMQPLKAVAGISIQDARTIVVQPWDRSILQNVEIALSKTELGTRPVNDGVVLRIVLPTLTEERRTQMTKIVHKLAEEAKVSIRQLRQTAQDAMKAEKDEDARYTALELLQKEVEGSNAKIDEAMKKKEEEVMKV